MITEAAEAGNPVLFFCRVGKDRTGVLAALLLSCCKATPEEIIADYYRSAPSISTLPAILLALSGSITLLGGRALEGPAPGPSGRSTAGLDSAQTKQRLFPIGVFEKLSCIVFAALRSACWSATPGTMATRFGAIASPVDINRGKFFAL